MNDMSPVIVPKSDQINADDLISGPMTITIRDVRISGGQDQPVSIYFEGNDKAFRPCKSMSRVLVQGWGANSSNYIGRSLTLYRDPTVKWAGMEVGGIRISHMSHIDGEKLMMLTATKGSRKPHKVKPLVIEQQPSVDDKARKAGETFISNVGRAPDLAKLNAYVESRATLLADLARDLPDLHARCEAAIAERRAAFAGADDESDPFGEDSEPTPAEQRLIDLREKIEAADTPDAVDAVSGDWARHRPAYDDATIAEVDGLVSAAYKRVRGGNA